MKHTPGPWVVMKANNYCGYAIAPIGTLPTLASVERPCGSESRIKIDCFNFPGETEANARLIAAAPELLEALDLLLDDYKIAMGEWSSEDALQIGDKLIAKARAAIVKATGDK